MNKKLVVILAAVSAFFTLLWVILKEVLKGKLNPSEMDTLKTGIREEKKQNAEVVRESLDNIKLQKKIIQEKTKEIHGMTMDEQLEEAKRLGLVE